MATKQRRPKTIAKPLTAAELEMMNVIWRIGPCSVSQVMEQLQPQRELAYTSVSTIVRILEQKGYVTSEKEGRGHLYAAATTKDDYQSMSLKHLVRNVFDGTPSLLVQRLLDSDSLTADELAQIKALLQARKSK
ncbi:MAG TPA: BlaI/MecI/CopY family transcriptional regulator [Steroidobacteraceae bacterium]|nr:BlaI/MecI/CopY family transcriptional regulator [Steroidobacteraceae bacterium]